MTLPAPDRLRRRLLRVLGATLAATALPTPRSAAQTRNGRIALVIGNASYRNAPLKNPVADAQAVAARLRQLGFVVTLRENATLRELIEAMREFSLRAPQASVRLFFYAGHGVQVRGRNYLVPVDSEPASEDEIPAKTADVAEFIDRLSGLKHGVNVAILDACRVNPFGGGVLQLADGRRVRFRGSTPAGLAPVTAPPGTLIAYSTSPGGVALDGADGRHSLYAKHLLAHLGTPGLPLEEMFKRVRIGVVEETARMQVPWESSSLVSNVCLQPGPGGACGYGK
ncbi:MAG: caspase family protein [Burkholderiaceae bacterium]|nr:caspase family protein [Burkholderiaceae bacterium]